MVIAEVSVSPFAFPVADHRYIGFATAEAFSVPKVRVTAQASRFEWPGARVSAYATSESSHMSLSASDWERVVHEVRLIEESGLVTAQAEGASQDIARISGKGFRMFVDEREFVARNWELLSTTYAGRYIAVLGTSILDSDTEFSALASRVYGRYGYKRIFMPFISTRKRVYRIPSPRIVR